VSLTVLANQLAFFVRFEYILHYLLRFVKRANVCTVPVVVICCILVHLSLFLMHLMCMRVPYFCRFFVIVHLTRCVLNSFSLTEISQWHQSAPDVEEPKPLSRPALILQKGCVHKLHVQNIGCHNCWVLTQIIAMALGAPSGSMPLAQITMSHLRLLVWWLDWYSFNLWMSVIL